LRDDVGGVSDPGAPNSGNSGDVLSSLPSTRPQRRSPKRDGAEQAKPRIKAASGPSAGKAGAAGTARGRASGAAKAGAAGRTSASRAGKTNAGATAKPRPQPATPRRQSARAGKTVAAQGYQPAPDTTPVEPPTGAEILASAVQAAGDVAHLGLTLGERLLRAAASRLPRP
jgi:hypothetical protein